MTGRLFIASVGNPGPLYNTFHSAGHHLLDSLHSALAYPPFKQNISIGSRHALYRSNSLMNTSGAGITRAYKSFLSTLPAGDRASTQLVILHDELELPLGQLKLRTSGSLKGHNGLKSVKNSLGGKEFARIGIGIGRPESRTSTSVSDYVLRKMTAIEKSTIQSKAHDALRIIQQLETAG